jgi:hypothetical protein
VGILIVIAIALGACYSPTLRDCALACTSDGDCVAGQVCTDDRLCTWSTSSRRCAPVDAPIDGARAPDSSAAIVLLHVLVDGDGQVELVGVATCDSAAPQRGDCELPARARVPATLVATPHDGKMFERWTSTACAGQGATCTTTPIVPMDVVAKFGDLRGA